MFMQRKFRCVFLAGLTCLLLVDGIQFGVQQEEEEKGPLVSLLKSSADRVIANAPIIINRDSELYQRYWKQRLPRRVSIKAILSAEESSDEIVENQKVQNEIVSSKTEEELINSIPESLPLVQAEASRDDEDANNNNNINNDNDKSNNKDNQDNQALPSNIDETVIKQDEQVGQNQVSLSHDEPGTSLADQLAELEVVESEVDETNYLPSGDLLRVEDGSRNISKILVKIKEQRQVRLPHLHPPVVYTPHVPAAAKTAVQQLAGQFVHAARYRSLPASRFDTSLVDERQSPAKTEVVDFSYKPLPENNAAPVPTGELGTISGTSGQLGTISELPAGTALSTDTFGFADAQDTAVKDTLFRHEVESTSFEGTTASSHVPSPYETVVTPPTTTPATIFITEPSATRIPPEPKQIENVALGQLYNGNIYVTSPTPRPFEPLYESEIAAVDNRQPLPVSQAAAALGQNYFNSPVAPPLSYQTFRPSNAVSEIRGQQHYETPIAPVEQNYGGYRPNNFQVELTTPHPPLLYGFQPVTSTKIAYQGTRFGPGLPPPPPVPPGYRGPPSHPPTTQNRPSHNPKHVRFPSFFYSF